MNAKSIFKKLRCPNCTKWEADQTGKAVKECSTCAVSMRLSDKWYVRLTHQGKTILKAVSSRRQDAVDYLHSAKDAARRGQLLPGQEKPIAWEVAVKNVTKWIQNGDLATGTKENYRIQLKHLSKFFTADLQDIDVRMVEDYRDSRMDAVAPKTVCDEIKFLKRMYVLECKWNPVRKFPLLHAAASDLSRVEMPKYNNKRTRFLSESEVAMLLDMCTEPHLKLAIEIALGTGLRLTNIMHLEWKQIDFINRKITYAAEDMKSGRLHVVPLMEHLSAALVTWRKSQSRISPFVFPSPSNVGCPMNSMRGSWYSLLDRCNLELTKAHQPLLDDVVFHTLRHTFASHFLMNGGDLSTLSELLDHASIQITKDRYGHLSDSHKRNAIDSFSGVFFKGVAA